MRWSPVFPPLNCYPKQAFPGRSDLRSWSPAEPVLAGKGERARFQVHNLLAGSQFRVHALVLDGKAVCSRPGLIDRLGCITKNERGASTLADILAVL